jgi:hypothetical protein
MSHWAGGGKISTTVAYLLCIGQPYFSVKQKMGALAIFKTLRVSPTVHTRNLKRFKFLLLIQTIMIYLHVF